MGHKYTQFTDNQKAEIYSRDRATCAFSCISLWMLDIGIRPNWDMDWVDHIKPSSSGGGAKLQNGICASSVFNAKKKNNAADNVYFLKDGHLSEDYILVFGTPPKDLVEQLARLKNVEPCDWFFNRCLANTFIGFNNRCESELYDTEYKRGDSYWFAAAWKRLQIFNKKRPTQNFRQRGLLNKPIPFGTKQLLKAEHIICHEDYIEWVEETYTIYRENYIILENYLYAKPNEQRDVLKEGRKNKLINPELIRAMSAHNKSQRN